MSMRLALLLRTEHCVSFRVVGRGTRDALGQHLSCGHGRAPGKKEERRGGEQRPLPIYEVRREPHD
jgi:hypothetical protein